jgi:alkylation response protein AidB-like acyl-CoA dehydrogenase
MKLFDYLRARMWVPVLGYGFYVAALAAGYYYNLTFVQLGLVDLGMRLVGMSRREVSMAKWYASELAWKVADEAVQVHGGYGYMKEFPVERAWRDARLGPIGGGTTEIMKELIGRSYGL